MFVALDPCREIEEISEPNPDYEKTRIERRNFPVYTFSDLGGQAASVNSIF